MINKYFLPICLLSLCVGAAPAALAQSKKAEAPSNWSKSIKIEQFPADFIAKYQQPESDFILMQGEKVKEISFKGGRAEVLQKLIEQQKAKAPQEMLVVRLSGKILVSAKPLSLPSKTVLFFANPTASVVASGTSSDLSALIEVKDSEYVALYTHIKNTKPAILDGKGKVRKAINVNNSGRVSIDHVAITGCKEGLVLTGRGDALLNEACSLTRSMIVGCTSSAVEVDKNARFVCADNVLNKNGVAMKINSISATVHGNTCLNNKTAMIINAPKDGASPYGVITQNKVSDNDKGIVLDQYAKGLFVTENLIEDNKRGMIIEGNVNRIFNNRFDNDKELELKGEHNIIIKNKDLSITEVKGGKNTQYFNPPTADNPHKEPVVLDKKRLDIMIEQKKGQADIDLKTVQAQLDEARKKNPKDYIVLWLRGDFVAQSEYTGLNLGENVSLVLDGTLYPKGSGMDRKSKEDHYVKERTTGGTQLVLFSGKGFGSMSGGMIDAKNMSAYGIYAPHSNILLIDQVKVQAAVDNNIGLLYHSGEKTPAFVHQCSFNGFGKTNRAVWAHDQCSFCYFTRNVSNNHVADFVDLDAGANHCKVLFNYTQNEKRCGVFVEENASYNYIMGNLFASPAGTSVSLYSSFNAQVKNNMMLFNTTDGPNGINVRYAINTFTFNNVFKTGFYGVYLNAKDTYSAFNALPEEIRMPDEDKNFYFSVPKSK